MVADSLVFAQKCVSSKYFLQENKWNNDEFHSKTKANRALGAPTAKPTTNSDPPLRSSETTILAVSFNFRMVLATCWKRSPGGERSGGCKPFPHQRGLTFRPRVSGFPTYNNGAPSKRPPSSVRRLMAVIEQRTPSRVMPKQRINAIAQRRAAQAPRPELKHSTLHF